MFTLQSYLSFQKQYLIIGVLFLILVLCDGRLSDSGKQGKKILDDKTIF